MASWTLAGVQMDCRFADPRTNLNGIRVRLRQAAGRGARLIIFPECALTGYAFESKEEAWPHAEPIPGPATERLAADCRNLGVWAAFGLLERGAGETLYNACALVGPGGQVTSYRKIHLPYLGVDRFAAPGDRPFAVHDLGGLHVGLNICYDASFPEAARALTLLGADLVVLPTNWPPGARSTVQYLVPARALENHVYYAAVNRVGEERGFRFIGQSRVVACDGQVLAAAGADGEEILVADIDPEWARAKRVVHIPGKYEIDRLADRRPEMYGPLAAGRRRPDDRVPG